MTWAPLLDGDLEARARDALGAIVAALAARDPSEERACLASGSAGLALLGSYAGELGWAERCLAASAAAAASAPLLPGLYSGFTGVGFVTEHLRRRHPGDDDGDDPCAEIDLALADVVADRTMAPLFDLIGGMVGIGVYALERLPAAPARALLVRVLDVLEATAERGDVGITWRSAPDIMDEEDRARWPQGHHDVGLAHGVAGVIGLLGAVAAAGIERPRALALLDGAVAWILAQRLAPADGGGATFPSFAGGAPARVAWCYGDPGIAAALLSAAHGAGEPAWRDQALAIARAAAALPAGATGVGGACLCHGSIGLAHIYNRLAQASGDDALADAARGWYRRALDERRPGVGLGGWPTWKRGQPAATRVDEPGVLMGAAGIGLALAAAVSADEPAWDRALLLSARGAR